MQGNLDNEEENIERADGVDTSDMSMDGAGELDPLVEQLYVHLHGLARSLFRDERNGHTLQTTALVHEAYLRLAQAKGREQTPREQFLAIAATVIRRVLIDHARSERARKRGGQLRHVQLNIEQLYIGRDTLDLLALDEALEALGDQSERCAKIVEMRFFGSMTEQEIADITGLSRATVARDWRWSRAWLMRRLSPGSASSAI